MQNIAADEQRHIGFGVKLLSDLAREDPVRVPKAVAKILRDVTRYTAQVLMPPGWDERYITVFGATYDEVGVEGLTSMTDEAALGRPRRSRRCPDRPLLPPGLSPLEIAQRGRTLAQAGVIGVREGPSKRDPETVALLFDTIRRQVNPAARAQARDDVPVGVHRPRRADLAPDGEQRLEHASPRARRRMPDLRLRIGYQDWIDIVGERLDPRRALATGRLRPRGNPLALKSLMQVFPPA